MKTYSCLMTVFLFSLTSCTMMQPRSYSDQMDRESDGMWIAGEDFPVVSGDTGRVGRTREEISLRTPMNELQREKEFNRNLVKRSLEEKEAALSDDDLKAYKEYSAYLPSASEKLYYLSLDPSERPIYISSKRGPEEKKFFPKRITVPSVKETPASRSIASQVISPDIRLGMSKDDVRNLWGEPKIVEYSGSKKDENEHWVFRDGLERKELYFEAGQVSGWHLD